MTKKAFLTLNRILCLLKARNLSEIEKAKIAAKVLDGLSMSGKDLFFAEKGTAQEVAAARKLWFEGNKSRLMKIGVVFIMFPDPTPVTPVVGAGLITAGLVQREIQKRALHMEDIKKVFDKTLREIQLTKDILQ